MILGVGAAPCRRADDPLREAAERFGGKAG